ncbi:MAG: (2Fe-2S)-binding protein [Elusimicrobia bacterium]|nr:(2Fe-2S)-binding protein [Elusimicrobiota bacterium]
MGEDIRFVLNGKRVEVTVNPLKSLLRVLREDLRRTDVKAGCEQGECGSCTVIVDGKTINSCLYPAGQADGKQVTTIAGLNDERETQLIQKAYIEEGAVQCGFCTPGLILVTRVLLDKNPSPGEAEIRVAISGNLCRCTGYKKIFNAVKRAAKYLGKGEKPLPRKTALRKIQ